MYWRGSTGAVLDQELQEGGLACSATVRRWDMGTAVLSGCVKGGGVLTCVHGDSACQAAHLEQCLSYLPMETSFVQLYSLQP